MIDTRICYLCQRVRAGRSIKKLWIGMVQGDIKMLRKINVRTCSDLPQRRDVHEFLDRLTELTELIGSDEAHMMFDDTLTPNIHRISDLLNHVVVNDLKFGPADKLGFTTYLRLQQALSETHQNHETAGQTGERLVQRQR